MVKPSQDNYFPVLILCHNIKIKCIALYRIKLYIRNKNIKITFEMFYEGNVRNRTFSTTIKS